MSERISIKELVEVRKEEMQSMRPGLMSEIKAGDKTIRVYSPTSFEKSTYKVER